MTAARLLARSMLARRYLDEAVCFRPDPLLQRGTTPLRVARTLLTCRLAATLLNELHVPEESDTVYRFVNVHNPACPLSFDRLAGGWHCAPRWADHPVWGVNFAGAELLCARLGARLPTAAEWECFAANNDPHRRYPWGDDEPSPGLANYAEHYGSTTEVTLFPPNEIGLQDLAGNLAEWCRDAGPASPLERLVKGGAWSKDAAQLRIRAARAKWARLGTTTIGLRPVWEDR